MKRRKATNTNKYGAEVTFVDGIRFDSKLEANRYIVLLVAEQAGEIEKLELQPKFEIQPAFTDSAGNKHRSIYYVADFRYRLPDGRVVVEDTKGMETDVFKLKKKLILFTEPELAHQLQIVKKATAKIGYNRF